MSAQLTPIGAPAVAADPVVRAVLVGAPAVELDGVVEDVGVALAVVDVVVVVHVHAAAVALNAATVQKALHKRQKVTTMIAKVGRTWR
jgi:hypothetical protein